MLWKQVVQASSSTSAHWCYPESQFLHSFSQRHNSVWLALQSNLDIGSIPKADYALSCPWWGSQVWYPRTTGYRILLGRGVWGPCSSVEAWSFPWDPFSKLGTCPWHVWPEHSATVGICSGTSPWVCLSGGRQKTQLHLLPPCHRWQHSVEMIKRPPAEWAQSFHCRPPPDASKAEVMEAQGHTGCITDFS